MVITIHLSLTEEENKRIKKLHEATTAGESRFI